MCEYDYNGVLEVASFAGKLMLENGGEIYRVEQTIDHICRAYGIETSESYATPTAIMISIVNGEGRSYSRIRRIISRSVNLDRVDAVNQLSRMISKEKQDLEIAMKQLYEIAESPGYNTPVMIAATAVGTAAFTVVFGGGVQDFFCGLIIGAVLRLVLQSLTKLRMGDFFVNLACGIVCAFLGWFFFAAGMGDDWRRLTLSALMLMVPGMLFTNSLRDVASGDLVSGISRAIEAVCIASALAVGASIVYIALLPLGGITL